MQVTNLRGRLIISQCIRREKKINLHTLRKKWEKEKDTEIKVVH